MMTITERPSHRAESQSTQTVPQGTFIARSQGVLRFGARAGPPPDIVCLGGMPTFGAGTQRPFPAILAEELGKRVANLGGYRGGIDTLLYDPETVQRAGMARLVILETPCAVGFSNRYYRVHPRYCDRMVAPMPDLIALYPGLDPGRPRLVRRLLSELADSCPQRAQEVAKGLRAQWLAQMERLLDVIGGTVLLLDLRHDGIAVPPPFSGQADDAALAQIGDLAARRLRISPTRADNPTRCHERIAAGLLPVVREMLV